MSNVWGYVQWYCVLTVNFTVDISVGISVGISVDITVAIAVVVVLYRAAEVRLVIVLCEEK